MKKPEPTVVAPDPRIAKNAVQHPRVERADTGRVARLSPEEYAEKIAGRSMVYVIAAGKVYQYDADGVTRQEIKKAPDGLIWAGYDATVDGSRSESGRKLTPAYVKARVNEGRDTIVFRVEREG